MAKKQRKQDPFPAFRFKIETDGIISGGFAECSGLEVEIEVEEYREGGLNEYVHKLPKGTKYGTIILKRGFIDSDEVWNWHQNVIAGKTMQRKNVSIILMDISGDEKYRWNIIKALPIKWNLSELKAESNAILVETLEFVHHGFTKASEKKS